MNMMELWAAVDIKGGRATTLYKGREDRATVWKGDPSALARKWEEEGATGIHVVDLDAAFGHGTNDAAIRSIVEAVGIQVELGGGVRSVRDATDKLRLGVDRLVIGTLAYRDRTTFEEAVETLGSERIVVAVDYVGEVVKHEGWTCDAGMTVFEATKEFERMGVRTILVTSIDRDGTGMGADLDTLGKVRRATSMRVLASGGIRDAEDVDELATLGVDGVVLGRALYDGSMSLRDLKGRWP